VAVREQDVSLLSAEDDEGPVEQWARRILGGAGATLLLATVMVTSVDVFGRYFFNAPLRGGFELTEVLMLCFIFPAIPLVTWRGGHISVDLFNFLGGVRTRRLHAAIVDLICLLVVSIMIAGLLRKSRQMAMFWDYTDTLRIPLAPLGYFVTVMLAATALALVLRLSANVGRLIR